MQGRSCAAGSPGTHRPAAHRRQRYRGIGMAPRPGRRQTGRPDSDRRRTRPAGIPAAPARRGPTNTRELETRNWKDGDRLESRSHRRRRSHRDGAWEGSAKKEREAHVLLPSGRGPPRTWLPTTRPTHRPAQRIAAHLPMGSDPGGAIHPQRPPNLAAEPLVGPGRRHAPPLSLPPASSLGTLRLAERTYNMPRASNHEV